MRLLSLCYLLIFAIVTTTQAMPLDTKSEVKFNVKKANQQFDQINLKLSVQNLNLNDLETAIIAVDDLVNQAEQCIISTQKKINSLNELAIQNSNLSTPDKQSVDSVYLNNQKKALSSEQAECRLFSIRAREAIAAYKSASAQIVKKVAFTRELPLWTNVNELFQQTPVNQITNLVQEALAGFLPPHHISLYIIGLSFFLSILLLSQFQKSQLSHHFLRFNLLNFTNILLLTATIASGCLLLYRMTQLSSSDHDVFLFALTKIIFYFLIVIDSILTLFRLKKIKGYFLLYSLNNDYFRQLSLITISFYAIGSLGALISTHLKTSNPLIQLSQSIYLLSIILFALYLIYYFCYKNRHNPFVQRHQKAIQWVSTTWLFICAIFDIQGYHLLAMNLTFSSFLTFAIVFITTLLVLGMQQLYLALYHIPPLQTWVLRYLGYKREQLLIEFLILKSTVQVVIVSIAIYLIGENIDFAAFYVENLFSQLINGIHFASYVIYPARILTGIVIFCLLFLICRALSTSIVRHHQFEGEEETQVALASILTYVGFIIALIAGLMTAGFNFTGLAIIAGALSVGIGLGLQSIVNNFVSGIILLIEKPIRPGDRISVDGAEGFVKKIRIRSTQIITPSREDIIIPNSDLITRRVTNYMFSDKNCRISCEIGVAYGSDTHLVRDILLNIANLHEDVVKTGRSKPVVLLHSFGESNLIFILSCLIKDVNKKSHVQSDLHFAIDEAFRKHDISMAYPQRDIHITWPTPTSTSATEGTTSPSKKKNEN